MQWIRISFVLFFLISVSFAQSAELNKTSEVFGSALVTVTFNATATLSVNEKILDADYVTGRSYEIQLPTQQQGVTVSSNGYILAKSDSDEKLRETAVKEVITPLLDDIGRIDHRKRYGIDPSIEELTFHQGYWFGQLGGKDKLNALLMEKVNDNTISIKIEKNPVLVSLSPTSTPIEAQIVDTKDGLVLLKVDKEHMPIVELKDKTIQNGDPATVIEDTQLKKTIIEVNDEKNYELIDDDTDDKKISLIGDAFDEPIALGFGRDIFPSYKIDELLEKNTITREPSTTNTEFKDGLDEFDKGNFEKAKEKFKSTLSLYPEHQGAEEYLEIIDTKETSIESKIKNVIGNVGSFVTNNVGEYTLLVIGAILLALLFVSKGILNILRRKKNR